MAKKIREPFRPPKSIDQLLSEANAEAQGQPVEVEEEPEPSAEPQSETPPGLMRIRILTPEHSDGRLKKTWKQNSVIEIDQYTAQRMIDRFWASPTTAALNEMLVEYKGK